MLYAYKFRWYSDKLHDLPADDSEPELGLNALLI